MILNCCCNPLMLCATHWARLLLVHPPNHTVEVHILLATAHGHYCIIQICETYGALHWS